MKKKNKILSVLILAVMLFACMPLGGCFTSIHGAGETTAFNSTHHWKVCKCGDNLCKNKYNNSTHNFEELERTTEGDIITIEYSCACGAVKTDVTETQEKMFNKLKVLTTAYKNLERSYTARSSLGGYLTFNHNTTESLTLFSDGNGKFLKIVASGNGFIMYDARTSQYLSIDKDAAEMIGKLIFGGLLDIPSLGEFQADSNSSITKSESGVYSATLKIDNKYVEIKYNNNALISFKNDTETLDLSDEFNEFDFNYYKTTGFTPAN